MDTWTASIAAGEPCEVVFNLRGADGISRPFLNRAIPLRDSSGAIVRWFGINTEIGGQVEAQAALCASEAKYSALTNAMPQIVWSASADGEPEYYNTQ
jgi:PAS domain-containing protein